MNTLSELQDWYSRECDGDWEHAHGVKIDTLDNPGWTVTIDLAETSLAGVAFSPIVRGDSEDDSDWVACRVEGQLFRAAGGSRNLEELLRIFLSWAIEHQRPSGVGSVIVSPAG